MKVDGKLVVRLKHFNPDLTGWEEKDRFVDFPFVAKKDGAMYFNGLTYMPNGKDGLKIVVAMRKKDGELPQRLQPFGNRYRLAGQWHVGDGTDQSPPNSSSVTSRAAQSVSTYCQGPPRSKVTGRFFG